MRSRSTLLPILLPALVAPVLLFASTEAEAKKLSISNGFRTAATYNSTGWDFDVHAEGVVELPEQNIPSTVDLSCSVHEQNETVTCIGELEIGNTIVDIRMDLNDNVVGWAIESGASTLVNEVHEEWSHEVVARTVAPGWSAIQLYFGGAWRWWYYMTETEDIFEDLTDMEWEEIVIWEI